MVKFFYIVSIVWPYLLRLFIFGCECDRNKSFQVWLLQTKIYLLFFIGGEAEILSFPYVLMLKPSMSTDGRIERLVDE